MRPIATQQAPHHFIRRWPKARRTERAERQEVTARQLLVKSLVGVREVEVKVGWLDEASASTALDHAALIARRCKEISQGLVKFERASQIQAIRSVDGLVVWARIRFYE